MTPQEWAAKSQSYRRGYVAGQHGDVDFASLVANATVAEEARQGFDDGIASIVAKQPLQVEITKNGYAPVTCDMPLPCPFCGEQPRLNQLAHVTQYTGRGKNRKKVMICIAYSSQTLVADSFKFECDSCNCSVGGWHATAQGAVEAWNTRNTGVERR